MKCSTDILLLIRDAISARRAGRAVHVAVVALVALGMGLAAQRLMSHLPEPARARVEAAALSLLAFALLASRRRDEDERASSAPSAEPPPGSMRLIEIGFPRQLCARCGYKIRLEHEQDRQWQHIEGGRVRYLHRGCVDERGELSP